MTRGQILMAGALLVGMLGGLCLGVIELKQGTARTVKIGPFVDISNGSTAETALTIHDDHVRLSKNGAAFAAKHDANDLTHDAAGWYVCLLDTTDTATLGSLQLEVQDANTLYGAWHEYQVVSAQYYNNKYGTALVQANVVALDGDATATEQSLLDLIDFVDYGYHPDINAVDVNDAEMATTTDIEDALRRIKGTPIGDVNDGSSDALVQDVNDFCVKLLTAIELDGAVWRFTTNALEQGMATISDSAKDEIADAVWDEILTGHTTYWSAGWAMKALMGN